MYHLKKLLFPHGLFSINSVDKSMFLKTKKLKRHTPLASNLTEIVILFLHPRAKLRILFSLLLKLKFKTIHYFSYFTNRIWWSDLCFYKSYNVIIYYPIISYYSLLLTCFKSDLTLLTRTVRESSERLFPFIVKNKSFCFRRSYSINASLFTFYCRFFKFPYLIKFS